MQDGFHTSVFEVTWRDDEETLLSQCGDLVFADQSGTMRARWMPLDTLHPLDTNRWEVKHRRTILADSMDVIFEQLLPGDSLADETFDVVLRSNADAIGWRLGIGIDPAATPALFDLGGAEGYAMLWRHLDPPTLDSVNVTSNVVSLFWTNQHAERSFDETRVYRNGAYLTSAYGTAASAVDTLPGPGTYIYSLRHWAPATPEHVPNTPNSAFSATDTVTAPLPITATITGPDGLFEDGWYSWTATPSGGVGNPYHFQWYRHQCGSFPPHPVVPVGSDKAQLTLYEDVPALPDCFRLIVSIWDDHGWATDSAEQFLVYTVEEPEEAFASGGGPGLRDAAGRCIALPGDPAARTRVMLDLLAKGVALQACVASSTQTQ